ncbi:MAG: hypothetical protein IH936_09325 [Acidobacteria bacterium]|nr:hypothetical protein [Acidobacteriota bacterium]
MNHRTSRNSRFRALVHPLAIAVAVLAFGVAEARPAGRDATEAAGPSFVRGKVQPYVRGRSLMVMRRGVRLAKSRLRDNSTCRQLFEAFGKDAKEVMDESRYHWVALSAEETACQQKHAAAFTWVGEDLTCLCPAFASLSVNDAAIALVHEALHHAGLTEQPGDPLGMTRDQIDQMVRTSCRL